MLRQTMDSKSAGLLVVVLLAVATATAATALDCALPENDSQVFPNPANCSTYYICSKGNPVLMPCPPGLIWNSNVSACDFPWNWECKDQQPAVQETETELLVEPQQSSFKDFQDHIDSWIEENNLSNEEVEEESDYNDESVEYFNSYDDIPIPDCAPDANYTSYPNPYNCSQFYECDNGVATLIDCPPGLHFNVEFGVCDFVWAANCTELPLNETAFFEVSEEKEEDESVYAEPNCPPPGTGGEVVRFPNEDNCTTFWICDNGQASLLSCPIGLVYNPAIQNCDFAWALNCTGICCPNKKESVLINKELEHESAFTEPNCPPPGTGGEVIRFPNEDNCTTFWICDNGQASLLSCPIGLVYNPAIQNCDFAWALNCTGICCPNKKESVLINKELEQESTFTEPNCPPPGTGGEVPRFPNEDNCTTFWICDNGKANLVSCPIGLVYNPAIQNCDFAWALNCTGICCPNKKESVQINKELEHESAFTEPNCPPPGTGGEVVRFPNEDNCTTFWICDNGQASLLSCPIGLVYNPAIQNCDFAWALNCTGICCPNKKESALINKELEHDKSTFTEPNCPPPGTGGEVPRFPNEDNCTTFWICDNGKANLVSCPIGLVYNPAIQNCDFAWALNCTGICCPNKKESVQINKELEHESTFTEPNCPPPGTGGEVIRFPNEDNCTTFWICDNGQASLVSCAIGLVYNPAIQNCDFAWALNCTGICCPNKKQSVLINEELKHESTFTEPNCPPPGTGGEVIRFPNEDNCTTFWICDNGQASLLSCPIGLVYNPAIQNCDFAWALNCTGICCPNKKESVLINKELEQESTFTEPNCPPPGTGGEVPRFPNEDNCTTFWICDNGQANLVSCPIGLVYNPAIQNCDFAWALNCTGICCPNKKESVLINKELEHESIFTEPNCPPPGTGGEIPRFPNEDNCTTFWICDNGKANLLSCPIGLVYNPAIQNCDFAWALNCTGICCPNKKESVLINKELEQESTFTEPNCPPPGTGGEIPRFPNEDNCTTFWICDNGKANLLSCPIGLVYNPAIQNCDFAWALNCTGICCPNKKESVLINKELEHESTFTEPNCPPPGTGGEVPRFPNEDNCTTFWICDNGQANLVSCPIGLVYNPAIQNCDFAWALNCTGICCPNKIAPRSEVTCPKDPIDVVHIPNPDDCSSFYKCDIDEKPVLMKCPSGLEFNPVLLVCDFPENAQCSVQA